MHVLNTFLDSFSEYVTANNSVSTRVKLFFYFLIPSVMSVGQILWLLLIIKFIVKLVHTYSTCDKNNESFDICYPSGDYFIQNDLEKLGMRD